MTPAIEREAGSRTPTDIDLYAGKQVRKFRADDNLTLQDLSERLGISHQQLQKYETGTNRMSVGMLHAVAAVMRRPVSAFLPGEADGADIAGRLRVAERRLEKIRAALSGG